LDSFPSDFNNFYLPEIFWAFTEFNQKLQDITRVYESLQKFVKGYDIP